MGSGQVLFFIFFAHTDLLIIYWCKENKSKSSKTKESQQIKETSSLSHIWDDYSSITQQLTGMNKNFSHSVIINRLYMANLVIKNLFTTVQILSSDYGAITIIRRIPGNEAPPSPATTLIRRPPHYDSSSLRVSSKLLLGKL